MFTVLTETFTAITPQMIVMWLIGGALIYLAFIDNLSRPLVEQLHAAGYIVDGSVINSPERLQLALDIGCDMIESEVPDQVIGWYRAMGREAAHHA